MSKIPTETTDPIEYVNEATSQLAITLVTPSQVKKSLQKVNVSKATGMDIRILKIAAPVIHQQLTYILNLSIRQSTFPDDWKKARVLPVYKTDW